MSDKMSLSGVPAVLKPGSGWLGHTTQPRGENGKPTPVTEMELVFELDLSEVETQADYLFPGIRQHCQMVAGLEHYKGETRTARTKLPEMNIVIDYKDDEVFAQGNTVIKKPAQLKIGHKGDAKMVIKVRVKLTAKEQTALSSKMGADIRISMEPTTQDLSEDTELVSANGQKKTRLRVPSEASVN